MKDFATKYYCTACHTYKWLPERPLSPERSVKTGCETCEYLTRHKPVGVP